MAAEELRRPVIAINDADAAGLAELRYGAARAVQGTVLLLTLGTGIGSALFVGRQAGAEHRIGDIFRWRAARPNTGRPGAPKWSRTLLDAWADQLNLVLGEMHALLCRISSSCAAALPRSRKNFWTNCIARRGCALGPCVRRPGIVGAALATMVVSTNRA